MVNKEHYLLTPFHVGSPIIVPKIDGKDQVCVERASFGLGGGHQIAESRQRTGGNCQHQSFDPRRIIISSNISSKVNRVDRFCLNTTYCSGSEGDNFSVIIWTADNTTHIHRVALEAREQSF